MKLILTEYINSLKEDGELDGMIQEMLRAYNFEIFSKPERGRQYGVDIYAVGPDFEDNNKRKVFLITVKQGDLDRVNWNGNMNSVQQSLDEIRTVFVRNNLAPQHLKLPVKIIVAFNGQLKQSIQQSWRGYADDYPTYDFVCWGLDFLSNHFQFKLLNEQAFSNEIRSLFRKTIIHLENPDYNFKDFDHLSELLVKGFRAATSKREKVKLLKQLRLIISIISKYSEEANNLKHAVKVSEKYILTLWGELSEFETDKVYSSELINGYKLHLHILVKYISKIRYITAVKDGFSRSSRDSLSYTYVVYEQIGFFALCGLHFFQLYELRSLSTSRDQLEEAEEYKSRADDLCDMVIATINNNLIFYYPRADDHVIEINLVLILLYELDRKDEIKTLLEQFWTLMKDGLIYSNIFPVFSNSKREIAELEANFEKRKEHDYKSSTLLTVLIEWTVVIDDKDLYALFRGLKENLMPDLELVLWFPDKSSEEGLFKKNVTNETGYTLANIGLPPKFEDFKQITKIDYENNCQERDFVFFKMLFWTIGLIASRHFRTYTFPFYWRQFLVKPEGSKQVDVSQ